MLTHIADQARPHMRVCVNGEMS